MGSANDKPNPLPATIGQAVADQLAMCWEAEVNPTHAWLAGAEYAAGVALRAPRCGVELRLLAHRCLSVLSDVPTEVIERDCDTDVEATVRGVM